jgi:hypothetical protein
MSTAVRQQRVRKLHPSYLALVQEWPLRPIRTAADYQAAGKVLNRLILNAARDPGEREMSKKTIRILSEHFRLNPWYFLSGMPG